MTMRNLLPFYLITGFVILLAGCSTHAKLAAVPPTPKIIVPTTPQLEELPLRKVTIPTAIIASRQPKFDSVDAIIAKAEASFETGRKNYRAGHLEMAKKEFNSAIDGMLAGPVAIKDDRRLAIAFDSLVDRIHSYELEALRQGDGFSEPTYQPAPLDELETLTFPENPELQKRAQADAANTQSDLPLVVNSQVASFIDYFANGRGRSSLEAGLRRSGRLHDMIVRILTEEGVPRDLIYLAQAESSFQYMARSTAGATGIWQFMAATGKPYGLDKDWWQDERLNPEKATRAAAQHLRDLYNNFGDWYLAMAAYNCGPMCVQNAVEHTGYADFWELSNRHALPTETRNYVLIILALTIISKNPEKYGIDTLVPESPLVYDSVTVTDPVDLRLAAEIVGSRVETLRELNPNLLRMTTPKIPEYELRIPLATKEVFLKKISMIPAEKRVWWRWHAVSGGETLTSIARMYRSTPQAIAEVNNLDLQASLNESSELIIPVSPVSVGELRYRVRGNETLASIARRYKVSADDLVSWNHLSSKTLSRGMVLTIPSDQTNVAASSVAPQTQTASKSTRTKSTVATTSKKVTNTQRSALVHKVKKGESLAQIAAIHNTSIEAIKQRNRIFGSTVRIGASLLIPVK